MKKVSKARKIQDQENILPNFKSLSLLSDDSDEEYKPVTPKPKSKKTTKELSDPYEFKTPITTKTKSVKSVSKKIQPLKERKQKQKEKEKEEEEEEEEEEETEIKKLTRSTKKKNETFTIQKNSPSHIPDKKVGEGCLGCIYKYKTEYGKIAVKTSNGTEESEATLRKESCILLQLQHPHLVELRGLAFVGKSCKLGMMMTYYPESLQEIIDDGDSYQVNLQNFAKQTISCIKYMHNKGIVHRDIKAENILLENPGGKISLWRIIDFGEAVTMEEAKDNKFLCGTKGYQAPEILNGKHISKPAAMDMYSLGMVFHYIVSGIDPYARDEQETSAKAQKAFYKQLQKEIPSTTPSLIKEMIEGTLDPNPTSRLTCDEVEAILRLIDGSYPNTCFNCWKFMEPNC